jgi:amino acid transporter
MDFFKSFFDVTKLPTKIFLVVSIVTGVFIFSGSEILKKLHLDKFQTYEGFVGLAFLFSTVLVVVNLIIWIFDKLHFEFKLKKLKAEYKQILTELDPKEKAVLREFIICSQSSIDMPYNNPVIAGLLGKNILTINKQFGNSLIMHGTNVPVSISRYFLKILKLEDVDLMENPTEEEKYLISENRPEWVKSSRRY